MTNALPSARWAAICTLSALMLNAFGSAVAQEGILIEPPEPLTHPSEPLFQPTFSGCTVQGFPPVNPDFEQQVVELVNDHRASVGRPPLKRVNLLDEVARYHARDMKEDDYFSHDTQDRVNNALQFVCSWNTRIDSHYPNRTFIGENIAAGYTTPQAVMTGWLNSTGHRSNIESPNYWEIGVGYDALGGAYGRYWVQNFGRRSNIYPLVINREYSRTASPNVTLYIYGAWTQVRLRNDSGAWSAWQPFTNTLSWTLNWVQGTREVCAEFTSGSQTFSACDTILLTTSGPKLTASPATLSFVHDLSTGQLYPQPPLGVQLSNTGNSSVLSWNAGTNQPWLTVTPSSGSTPGTAQVGLVPSALPNAPGTYSGVAIFSSGSMTEPVTVTLRVVSALPHKVHLPAALR